MQEILNSNKWKDALSYESFVNYSKPRMTPLRKLVRKMPGEVTHLACLIALPTVDLALLCL